MNLTEITQEIMEVGFGMSLLLSRLSKHADKHDQAQVQELLRRWDEVMIGGGKKKKEKDDDVGIV